MTAERAPNDQGWFVLYRAAGTNAETPAVCFGDGKTWPDHMRGRVVYAYPIEPQKFCSAPLELLREHFDKLHAAQQKAAAG